MLSIITAIHNQQAMNRLFWHNLHRYTYHKFELIIIDNASSDGSGDFFRSLANVKVITNTANFSYPYSQNQGINIASYPWLVFMNNDVIVSPHWDLRIIANMQANKLEVATVCGIEHLETAAATKSIKRRWQKIKNLLSIFGNSYFNLQLMHRLMYKNAWREFNQQRYTNFKLQIKEGFVGNTVVMCRSALTKIGLWDETIQAADFDLYIRTKRRELDYGDMRCVHICLDVFIHHYIRLTIKKNNRLPFADAARLVPLEAKWDAASLALVRKITQ